MAQEVNACRAQSHRRQPGSRGAVEQADGRQEEEIRAPAGRGWADEDKL